MGKMMTCKAIPQIMWKAAFLADFGKLEIPVLKKLLDQWGASFRITVCKYAAEEHSEEVLNQRMILAKEVIAASTLVKPWAPKAILQSACFHKNSEMVERFEEDLWDSLQLTSEGSQWLSKDKLEKMES